MQVPYVYIIVPTIHGTNIVIYIIIPGLFFYNKKLLFLPLQEMPVILAGNHEQKKKYLGRMIDEPLVCVSKIKSPNP